MEMITEKFCGVYLNTVSFNDARAIIGLMESFGHYIELPPRVQTIAVYYYKF